MSLPLVSIIIPVYNRADLISFSLDAVLNQSYTNWECLIIDDGSTDDSVSVIHSYTTKDDRFRLFQQSDKKNKGANYCRNFGIKNANGEYFQFLDSDDYLFPQKIESQVIELLNYSKNTVAICKWDRFKTSIEEANFMKIYPYYKNFESPKNYLNTLGKKWIPPLCYLVPRKLVENAGPWNEDLIINQDAEYFIRILINARNIIYVDKAKVLYRHHTETNVSKETPQKIQAKIDTFTLMEKHLEVLYQDEPNLYIERSKKTYFNRIRKRFPNIIRSNKQVFSNQIKERKLINRILRKLNFEI